MAAKDTPPVKPEWLIDLHGIKEALTTRSNARARIIDAIQNGEMLIVRSVQIELKDVYPDLWQDFVAIKPKKYIDIPVSVQAAATQLQEIHGAPLLGGVPHFCHFESVALANAKGMKVISAGKGLADCQRIAKKCGLTKDIAQSISAV